MVSNTQKKRPIEDLFFLYGLLSYLLERIFGVAPTGYKGLPYNIILYSNSIVPGGLDVMS